MVKISLIQKHILSHHTASERKFKLAKNSKTHRMQEFKQMENFNELLLPSIADRRLKLSGSSSILDFQNWDQGFQVEVKKNLRSIYFYLFIQEKKSVHFFLRTWYISFNFFLRYLVMYIYLFCILFLFFIILCFFCAPGWRGVGFLFSFGPYYKYNNVFLLAANNNVSSII